MPRMTRRSTLAGIGAALAFSALKPLRAAERLPELVLWGPPAGPSVALAHAVAAGLFAPVAERVHFKVWRSPDELRAGLTSRTMDVFVLPTQAAANLFNKGLGVRLVTVMTDGLLHLVSADPGLTSIAALKRRTVALPFRNDTPEFLFRRLLARAGLAPETDTTIQFTGTPMEAVQLLMTGRADAALLPEPSATAAILRAAEMGRTIERTIDIQTAWAAATGLTPSLPQAGLGVSAAFLDRHGALVPALHDAIAAATAAVHAAPERAAADSAPALGLPEAVIARSIPHSRLVSTPAREARPALETLYREIAGFDARIIGGGLPASDFYL